MIKSVIQDLEKTFSITLTIRLKKIKDGRHCPLLTNLRNVYKDKKKKILHHEFSGSAI
jgi:hypothetical protein